MSEESRDKSSLKSDETDGLYENYANNLQIETSVWDLKLRFGQLSQRDGAPATVHQHTEITIPWLQAKLLAYFLTVNVAIYEAWTSPINVPDSVLPPSPEDLTESEESSDPRNVEARERIAEAHRQFFD